MDWYEAFADAVHELGKKWPDVLTEDEERQCEEAADKVAVRPEVERTPPDHPTIAP
jgi:hypothetical protein